MDLPIAILRVPDYEVPCLGDDYFHVFRFFKSDTSIDFVTSSPCTKNILKADRTVAHDEGTQRGSVLNKELPIAEQPKIFRVY